MMIEAFTRGFVYGLDIQALGEFFGYAFMLVAGFLGIAAILGLVVGLCWMIEREITKKE